MRHSCAQAPFLKPVTGDVLHVLGNPGVGEEHLRIPDLECLSGAEEQREKFWAKLGSAEVVTYRIAKDKPIKAPAFEQVKAQIEEMVEAAPVPKACSIDNPDCEACQ